MYQNVPSRSLTKPLKSYLPNRKLVFQPPFRKGYVKLWVCIQNLCKQLLNYPLYFQKLVLWLLAIFPRNSDEKELVWVWVLFFFGNSEIPLLGALINSYKFSFIKPIKAMLDSKKDLKVTKAWPTSPNHRRSYQKQTALSCSYNFPSNSFP